MESNKRFEVPVKFRVEEAFTYGVTNGMHGGYSFSVRLDPQGDQMLLLKSTALSNGATMKFYGEDSCTIYLQCDQLTQKQRDELLAQRIMIIYVEFEATGTYKRKDGTISLRLKLTRLRKVRVAEKIKAPPPED